jgi:hypothetical protein
MITAVQAAILFAIIRAYSAFDAITSTLLAAILSLPAFLLFRERKIEEREFKGDLSHVFRRVLLLTILLSLTYPFAFYSILESSKPDAPKEKFDMEALVAVGRFILMMTFYIFSPWIFALIMAKSYGYNWKALRNVEARRHLGQIYFLLFLMLAVGMMSVIFVTSSERYQNGGSILELVVAELALFAATFSLLTFLLRINGYGWKDVPDLIAYASSLSRQEFYSDRKAGLARNVIIGIFAYIFLAFLLADFVLRGEALQFFVFIAKLFAILGVMFLPFWLAGELYRRRKG